MILRFPEIHSFEQAPPTAWGLSPNGRSRLPLLVGALAGALIAFPAGAQRAEQNVVTSADDAFGTSVGSQSIGLYSMTDARGFNPQQAGNLRIEGLYFDTPTPYLAECMVREQTMRIGIAAQSYSFPSPTGIVDVKLPIPGDKTVVSGYASQGPFDESTALLEVQGRLSPQLAAFACVGTQHDFVHEGAKRSANVHATSLLRWQPMERLEIVPFVALQTGSDRAVIPAVYTESSPVSYIDGASGASKFGLPPPPLFDLRHLATQPFTTQGWRTTTFGAIARYVPDAEWSVTLGLFRVIEEDPLAFYDEYLSILPNRTADHQLDVTPPYNSASTSGEFRVARTFGSNTHTRTVEFAVRGRRSNKDYGGDATPDYGIVSIDNPPSLAPTTYATTAISIDETQQLDAGVLYEERWQGVGSLAMGLLRSHYQRTIIDPTVAPETENSSPTLGSLRFTATPATLVTLYGSFVQGFEDAALAPITAMNRGQPPLASRTHQADGGLRWAPDDKLSVVFGAFEIDKAYLNLDAANVYTVLGTVRHRGLESSVTYARDGCKLVAGGVLLRPHVDRVLAEPGATGLVPVGPVPLTLTANVDCAPPRWQPWAASLQWNYLSTRPVTQDDANWLPQFATISAGARYESTVHGHPLTIRFDAVNLTDARGLRVSSLEQVFPDLGRRFTLSIAIDN